VPSGLTVDSDPDDPASGYNILRGFIGAHKPELIILDSFTRIHAGSENDAGSMADVNGRIRTLRDEFGCAVLIIDHVTKIPAESAGSNPGVRLRGSTEKLAAIDAGMLIERGTDGIVCDPSSKARYTEALPPFTVELRQTERGGLTLRYGAEKKKEEASTARDVMLAIHELEAQTGREGVTALELAGYLGVSQSTINRHCNALVKVSLLITTARPTGQKGGKPARAYTVPREREETMSAPVQEPL
jgi:RecA-family ATPase